MSHLVTIDHASCFPVKESNILYDLTFLLDTHTHTQTLRLLSTCSWLLVVEQVWICTCTRYLGRVNGAVVKPARSALVYMYFSSPDSVGLVHGGEECQLVLAGTCRKTGFIDGTGHLDVCTGIGST